MKYKVGDKITVRSDLIVGNYYGGVEFRLTMKVRLGINTTIRKVHSVQSNRYRLASSFGSWWTSEMFVNESKIIYNYSIL